MALNWIQMTWSISKFALITLSTSNINVVATIEGINVVATTMWLQQDRVKARANEGGTHDSPLVAQGQYLLRLSRPLSQPFERGAPFRIRLGEMSVLGRSN